MKKTAVEWLVEQLNEKAIINGTVDLFVMNILIKQSIPMEKEQITDSYIMGSYDMAEKKFRPEQYYNETFKSE